MEKYFLEVWVKLNYFFCTNFTNISNYFKKFISFSKLITMIYLKEKQPGNFTFSQPICKGIVPLEYGQTETHFCNAMYFEAFVIYLAFCNNSARSILCLDSTLTKYMQKAEIITIAVFYILRIALSLAQLTETAKLSLTCK